MAEIVAPGEVLGERYRLEQPLGAGGMATVWRAVDLVLDRAVAVKVPREGWPEGFTRRLREEAKAAAALSHPNITSVHDYGEHRRIPYVVMELLDGETLSARRSRGPLPWREAAATCAQVADALAAAHAAGIVHRDIKPANVFLTPVGVKVLDFGIAFTGLSPSGGPVLGTPDYVAPELLNGGEPAPSADVYSLGVVLQECLTGTSSVETTLPPNIPGEVVALSLRCLNPDPRARPTAATAARVLAEAAGIRLATVSAESSAESSAGSSAGRTDDPPAHEPHGAPTRVLADPLPPADTSMADAADGPGKASARKPLVIAGAAVGAAAAVAVLLAALSPDSTRREAAPPPGSAPPQSPPSSPAGGACAVAYRVDGTWPRGFQATVRITNLGDAPVDGWRLEFAFPDGQAITQLWNGTQTQNGPAVTVTAADWNRSIPPDGSAEFGFLGSQNGANGRPSRFVLNGRECRG